MHDTLRTKKTYIHMQQNLTVVFPERYSTSQPPAPRETTITALQVVLVS